MKKRPRLSVHPLAAAGLFLLLFVLPRGTAFAALSSVLLHEAGHATAAFFYGRPVERITLMPVGISMTLAHPASYREEAVIAAAGPLLNVLYLPFARFLPAESADAAMLFSESLALINLLPIRTLDGGRIAEAVLSSLVSPSLAEKVLRVTTAATLFALWIPALFVFFESGENAALLLFCSYLFAYLIVKKEKKPCASRRFML